MAHAGILTEADRVELIDGEIVQATSISRRHVVCVAQLMRRLTQGLSDRALVWPRTRSGSRANQSPSPT